MKDEEKTKEQFIEELAAMRQRLVDLEASEAEHERANKALRQSEERLRGLFETMAEGVVLIASDGQIVQANPAAERILGLQRSEIESRNYIAPEWEILRPEETRMPPEEMAGPRAMKEKRLVKDVVMGVKRPDGSISWINVSAAPLMDEAGKFMGVVGTFADITERKRAEEAMRESEEKYRNVVERADDGICIIQDTIVQYLNPRLAEMWGGTVEEVIGTPFTNYVDPDELAKVVDRYKRRMAGEDVTPVYETVLRRRDGSKVYAELNAGITTYQAKPANLVIARDITERKRAEEALRESEERYRSLFDRVPVGLYRTTPAGQILDANPTLAQMLGYPDRESLLAISATDLYVDPEDRGQEQTLLEREGVVREFETQLRQRDGTVIWVKDTVRAVRNTEGRVLYYEGSLEDITERKRAEETLRESREKYREMISGMNDTVWVIGFDGKFMDVNETAVKALGYSREELLSMGPADIDSHLTEEQIKDLIRRMPSDEIQVFETEHITKEGKTIPVEISSSLVTYQGRRAILSIARDIAERKRAEEALRRSEQFLQDVFDAIQDGISVLDTDLNVIRTNHWIEQMYAHQMPLLGRKCYRLYQQRQSPCPWCPTLRTIETGESHTEIVPYPSEDNPAGWIELTAFPIKNEQGHVTSVIECVKDITERKRAEEALAHERDLLQALMDNIPDTLYFKDTASRFIRINRAQAQVLGIKDSEEAIGQTDFDFFTEEHAQDAYADEQEIVKSGQPLIDKVERIRRADGQFRWVSATKVPIMDEKGRVTGIVGISRDITEYKQAEEEIRRHLERIEALLEVDRAIISTLELTEVLDIILEELARVIPYHSAGIFLLSDGTAKLTAGRGFPDLERVLQVSFPVKEDPLTHELLQEKRPLILADAQADERFLARGGTEYVRSWIGVPLVAKGRAVGFLTIDHREPGVYDEESAEMARAFASQVAIAIENARLYEEAQRELAERKRTEEELQQSFETLRRAFEGTVTVLVSAVEMRDPYTAGHQRRVTQLACAIANEMDLPQEQIEGIRMAGLIHDIGKINVPAEILSKPSQLTDLEFGLIKMHPQTGHDVLKAIEFPWPVAQIVLQHHERMNGSGYPQGLSGEEIILEARILGVADVVEAMASHRPYRSARGIDKALEEISQNRSILYDPEVVDACLKLFTEKGFTFG
jgi:PAS domain S-box-containing protein